MQRWGTCLPNLGTLGLWVLELFAMHATDGRTDGPTKARLIAYGGRGIIHCRVPSFGRVADLTLGLLLVGQKGQMMLAVVDNSFSNTCYALVETSETNADKKLKRISWQRLAGFTESAL